MDRPYQFIKQSEGSTDLYIYGDITSYIWDESDTSSFNFAKDLASVETNLNVHINSYGGEVAEGLAIYNLLKGFQYEVTTICDGFACSAASVIFMAGSKRKMPSTSLLLIHNAWTYTSGDSNALRKQADDLELITKPSLEAYKAVSNLSEDEIKKMMDEETWITAAEALEYGFATEMIDLVEDPKQSLNDKFIFDLVMKNKALEAQCNDTNKNEQKGKDAWTSFFEGGK